jgi:uncharacterized integral membrane protein
MIAQLSLYGVYVPTLLIMLFAAYLLKNLVRSLLVRVGFYRWVWHPPLFNLALYVMLVGVLFTFVPGVKS